MKKLLKKIIRYIELKKHATIMLNVNQIIRLWYNFHFMAYLNMTGKQVHVRIPN